ncbi:MAG: hypothetical protein RLZZ519_2973 [Bacteroidota bacterium]
MKRIPRRISARYFHAFLFLLISVKFASQLIACERITNPWALPPIGLAAPVSISRFFDTDPAPTLSPSSQNGMTTLGNVGLVFPSPIVSPALCCWIVRFQVATGSSVRSWCWKARHPSLCIALGYKAAQSRSF